MKHRTANRHGVSTPASPRILSRDFNLTFRGRLTLQRRASAVQFLPSTPQKLPICQLKAPKAPELHTKAKGPSRAITFSERNTHMKYLIGWALGIPGVLIVLWFLVSHH